MAHVGIIGGGISGLSASWYLQQLAPEYKYTLIEAENCLGGKIKTERIKGFVIESGPESFLAHKPAAFNLCKELGLDKQIIPMDTSRLFVLHGGKLKAMPAGFKLIIPTDKDALLASSLFSEQGKRRILQEEDVPPRMSDVDESLASFIRRRFGEECLERVGGPLMGGIYVADPEKLSMKSAFPRLVMLEKKYGSLIKALQCEDSCLREAAISKGQSHKTLEKNGKTLNNGGQNISSSSFLSLRNGLGEIVEELTKRLNGKVEIGRIVQKIGRTATKFNIILDQNETIACDYVICTVPAKRAAIISAELNPELAMELNAIRFTSSIAVSLGFRKSEFESQTDFNGTGFIVSTADRRAILSCGITSNKSNYRASEETTLLRVFLNMEGMGVTKKQSDETWIKIALDGLKAALGIHCKPVLSRIFRWPQANPQFDVGHLERMQRIENLAAHTPGFFLTGCSYHGVGIPDCITNAQKTVERLKAYAVS